MGLCRRPFNAYINPMIKIPKDALSDTDDSGESVAPSVGDSVDLGGVTAKVTAADDDCYSLEVETVGGKPVVADAVEAEEKADTDDDKVEAPADDGQTITSKTGNDDERRRLLKAAAKSDARKGL